MQHHISVQQSLPFPSVPEPLSFYVTQEHLLNLFHEKLHRYLESPSYANFVSFGEGLETLGLYLTDYQYYPPFFAALANEPIWKDLYHHARLYFNEVPMDLLPSPVLAIITAIAFAANNEKLHSLLEQCGYPSYYFIKGFAKLFGLAGNVKDFQGAITNFQRAEALNHSGATYMMGSLYYEGFYPFVEPSLEKALFYFHKAAQSNHPLANYYYGIIQLRHKRYDEADAALQRAYTLGIKDAAIGIAKLYVQALAEKALPCSASRASQWFKGISTNLHLHEALKHRVHQYHQTFKALEKKLKHTFIAEHVKLRENENMLLPSSTLAAQADLVTLESKQRVIIGLESLANNCSYVLL